MSTLTCTMPLAMGVTTLSTVAAVQPSAAKARETPAEPQQSSREKVTSGLLAYASPKIGGKRRGYWPGADVRIADVDAKSGFRMGGCKLQVCRCGVDVNIADDDAAPDGQCDE